MDKFEDELVDGLPPETDENHKCDWVRDDSIHVAGYTKHYTSSNPQWDNITTLKTRYEGVAQRIEAERHEQAFHKSLKK